MKVLLSIPQPLGASGPSKPLTKLHEALHADKSVDADTIHPGTLGGILDDVGGFGHGLGPAYDDVANGQLARGGVPDVFLGGGGASLRQLLSLRGKTARGTLWFSTYWRHAAQTLGAEYAKWTKGVGVVHPYLGWRADQEQAESEFLIVPSQQAKDTYPAGYRERVEVAEFGVDLERYKPGEKRVGRRLKVLFPATNPVRKGLAYALEGWKDLPTAAYQMTVTGCQLAAMPTNVAPIVSTGFVPEAAMERFYQDHDVLLLPSLEEGQALAGLEAAASGMPLIVTRESGLPITDGVEGFVVPARDPAAIHKALVALQDQDTYFAMSRAARAWAEKRPWSAFTSRVISILHQQFKEAVV